MILPWFGSSLHLERGTATGSGVGVGHGARRAEKVAGRPLHEGEFGPGLGSPPDRLARIAGSAAGLGALGYLYPLQQIF